MPCSGTAHVTCTGTTAAAAVRSHLTDPMPDNPASALHVIASTDRRGAEVFAEGLVASLERIGRRGEMIAVAKGTTTTNLAVPDLGGLSVSAVRRLRRLAREHEHVIAHGSTSLPATAFATLGGPPFVYRSIGDPRYWSSSRLTAARVRPMLQRAAALVALWPAAADALVARGVRPPVVVIPNAVDTTHFRPPEVAERRAARDALGVDDGVGLVLYVGSLSSEKNPGTAIDACETMPDVHLVFAGDGPLRGTLEARASSAVQFVGSVDDVRPLLWAADALVVPSRTEGIPAAAIEAGACGVAVIASDVGGVASVVLDGQTGRLVTPGDIGAVRAGLAEALDGAFDREVARSHCVQTFDLAPVAQQWDALLRDGLR